MTWALVDAPAYAGRTPSPLKAACHDGTPFVEVVCGCGERQHYHESQTAPVSGAAIAGRCTRCGEMLMFPPRLFDEAFAKLRRSGWLAPREGVSQ